jgi:putative endonuclease
MKQYYIYILSNSSRTIFYTGITNDLIRRVYEHKHKLVEGFTSRYGVNVLLYFETSNDAIAAIEREKQIKKYSQKKKLALITKTNINFNDLYDEISAQ